MVAEFGVIDHESRVAAFRIARNGAQQNRVVQQVFVRTRTTLLPIFASVMDEKNSYAPHSF